MTIVLLSTPVTLVTKITRIHPVRKSGVQLYFSLHLTVRNSGVQLYIQGKIMQFWPLCCEREAILSKKFRHGCRVEYSYGKLARLLRSRLEKNKISATVPAHPFIWTLHNFYKGFSGVPRSRKPGQPGQPGSYEEVLCASSTLHAALSFQCNISAVWCVKRATMYTATCSDNAEKRSWIETLDPTVWTNKIATEKMPTKETLWRLGI